MRKNFCVLWVVLVAISCVFILTGCADFQKKFIRKKKEYDGPPKYYAVRKYEVHPSLELYEKRYIFWKNWHRELLVDINDENRKKAKVDIDQAISNLWDMKYMLVDEKGDELQKCIDQMQELQLQITKQSVNSVNRVKFRRKLDLLMREIKRKFSYRKMGGYIRSDFKVEKQY